MNREDYAELIRKLCRDLEIDDAGELLDRGLLRVDETLVGLEYLDEREEVRLLADLGAVDEDIDRTAMLELLLEANLANTSLCLPTFSLHPETGHPVVAYHIPLQALRDQDIDLADVLKEQLVSVLDTWKNNARDALEDGGHVPPAFSFPITLA